MNILIPVLIVSGIGLLAGLGLSIASVVMAVPKNETAEKVREALPGANCGACGFSGCDGYAEALASGKAAGGLCTPGGASSAEKIAAILGGEANLPEEKKAVVLCRGSSSNTEDKMIYTGVQSCAAAAPFFGGKGACSFGCIGYGDCAAACPFQAISLCDGVAVVHPDVCTGCGACLSACPKGILALLPAKRLAVVQCSNRSKGLLAGKVCKVSCIGCMKCVRVCEHDAIKVEHFLAKIDPAACTACGACEAACPKQCIHIAELS